MSPSDRPEEAFAGLLSTGAAAGGAGGAFIATLVGAISFGFGASAIFGAVTVLGASASFGGAPAAFDSTPCGCAAAKRPLNIRGEMRAPDPSFALTGSG